MNLNIIQTLQDKNLLGQFLDDPKTWRSWFCFLRAFFGLEPAKGDLELFQQCTGRQNWPDSEAKEVWLAIGVRGGKSYIVALLCAYLAVFRRYKLSVGEKGFIIVVAPTKDQAKIIKRYVSGFFNDNPFLKSYVTADPQNSIELKNDIIIIVISNDYKSLRGYTAIGCIVDEVAFLNCEGFRSDTETIRALRGRLLSTGGPLICISSPYAKRGELYKVWKKHFAKDESNILVWQADSRTMNPTLSQQAIDEAREEDPEGAKADYDAQFRSDIESYVSADILDRCVVPCRYELQPMWRDRGTAYQGFVDPSGGGRDSFTLAIAHKEGDMMILDMIRERRPPFSPDAVVQDFATDLKRYGLSRVTGDRYGGAWPRERFSVYGIKYELADKNKSDIYKEFLPMLNSQSVQLLDNQRLFNQIISLERRTARGGKDSIDHPPHHHDDLANSAAGVLTMNRVKKICRSLVKAGRE